MLRTRYPAFLFGLPMRTGEIPIFNYHDVEGPELEGDLAFLARNRYRTLSLEEFLAQEGRSRDGLEVLLTFDDARASVERVALPVLEAFRARAVLFVPTHWVGELTPGSREAALFMSWRGVRRCRDSGVFDIESHSHRHALVHSSPRLVGFADAGMRTRFDVYDWPMQDAAGEQGLGFPPLGTPIYAAAPLLSAQACYLESVEATRVCQALVAGEGGTEFLRNPRGLTELRRVHRWQMDIDGGRYLDARSLRKLIESDFELCWRAFERHLGTHPSCFAFPWMLGSQAALECARRMGVVAAFGCALDYRRARAAGLPVKVFGRLKSDWLRLLPGEDRASLASVLARKAASFSSLHNIAH